MRPGVTGVDVLPAWFAALEGDASLEAPARLRERFDALERLERHFGPGDHDADEPGVAPGRVRALRARLERANAALHEAIRDDIRHGRGRAALQPWIDAAAPGEGGDTRLEGEGYDALDDLVDGVLRFDPPGGVAALPPGMVAYQPTPARHVVDMIDRAGLGEDDVLFDLGSGLGHVPLLAAILARARCIGVEIEPAYVECARRSAAALGLGDVAFLAQDARAADLSGGTVFYLYTPFTGAILRAVLGTLRREAARRAIRVCTFGPCTPVVAREPWLRTADALREHRVAIFHPRR
ncbi:MAG TPA: hypothetical protein VM619_09180 [Luteimonas sp.]|nr:hypothetical protein [Luteimonas sp.]